MYTIIGADQKEYGPITEAQILQWISEGRVNGKTLAKVEGGAWKPVATFPELAAHLPQAPSTLAAGSSPPEAIPGAGREAALSQVKGPAIGLMITGILGIVLTLVGIAIQAAGFNPFGNQLPPMDPQMERIVRALEGSQTITSLLSLVVYGLVLFGAIKMRNLQSYGLCMAASILAILPCSCPVCCAGIPLGIWALVVLAKTEVSSQFH